MDFCPTIFPQSPELEYYRLDWGQLHQQFLVAKMKVQKLVWTFIINERSSRRLKSRKNLWVILDRIYEAIKLKGPIQKYSPHNHLMWIQSNVKPLWNVKTKQNINKWNVNQVHTFQLIWYFSSFWILKLIKLGQSNQEINSGIYLLVTWMEEIVRTGDRAPGWVKKYITGEGAGDQGPW